MTVQFCEFFEFDPAFAYIGRMRTVGSVSLLCVLLFSSGCSILVGNVKPVTEHSTRYQTMDLTQSPDWTRLGRPVADGRADSEELEDPDITEFAWQSKTTGAVISLNSGCRAKFNDRNQSLEDFTEQLVLGTTEISDRSSEAITVSGHPGLQTTLTGTIAGKKNRLRVIVVRVNDCVYDLMYIARPTHFDSHLKDFSEFVQAFRLDP